MKNIPFIKPNPPRLSENIEKIREMEASGIFSNFGPENNLFQDNIVKYLFNGEGHALTVCNATIGLMIAVREAIERTDRSEKKYALMPSFTFSATGHSAAWNNLTPIFVDIDPETLLPDHASEDEAIRRYGDDIAVIMPYATFGNCLDLDRYSKIQKETGIPVVVDAAASLGAKDIYGRGFGSGSDLTIVYSMHVTKTFSTSEGGVVYSANSEIINRIKLMSNFGFDTPRSSGMIGLNAKLSEFGALIANLKLEDFHSVVDGRQKLASIYRAELDDFEAQQVTGEEVPFQFFPIMVPDKAREKRDFIISHMADGGISCGKYFSPHLAQQPYFALNSIKMDLKVTEDICERIISLPLYEGMTGSDVKIISDRIKNCMRDFI